MIGSSQLEMLTVLATGIAWQEPWLVPGSTSRMLVQGTKPVIVG